MDVVISAIVGFFQEFMSLGATVLLPVVIAILGIFFRMKPSQAIRAGLLVGIGFQGRRACHQLPDADYAAGL